MTRPGKLVAPTRQFLPCCRFRTSSSVVADLVHLCQQIRHRPHGCIVQRMFPDLRERFLELAVAQPFRRADSRVANDDDDDDDDDNDDDLPVCIKANGS